MKSKVYYTKNITPENLINIYEALGINLDGNVGIKVSTGEDGAKGYLKKELIGPLVKKLNGTIIECNTAYNGKRNTAEEHMQVAKKQQLQAIGRALSLLTRLRSRIFIGGTTHDICRKESLSLWSGVASCFVYVAFSLRLRRECQ